MSESISIAIVDDHPLFREGVIRSLGETGRFTIVAEGASQDDAIRIAHENTPDLMLIDLSMPGGGLGALHSISQGQPSIALIVLTASEAIDDVTEALNIGVSGYVLKGVGSRALVEILIAVASGETYVSPTLSAKLLTHLAVTLQSPANTNPLKALSPRELEVLGLIASGKATRRWAMHSAFRKKRYSTTFPASSRN